MKALKIKFKGVNPFIKLPEVGDKYNFISYGSSDEQLAEGTVEVTVVGETTITLKVLTNEPNTSFVGQSFDVKIEDIGKDKLPLYTTEGESTGMYVVVSEYTEQEPDDQQQEEGNGGDEQQQEADNGNDGQQSEEPQDNDGGEG